MVAVVLLMVLYVNVSIHYQPEIKVVENTHVNYDLLRQLRHLKSAIHDGAAKEMQAIYPEGSVFLHSLYALAWCDFLKGVNRNSSLFQEGILEIGASVDYMSSEQGRSTFSEYQPLVYGAFYTGWSTYVLGRQLELSKRGGSDDRKFKNHCERIAEFLKTSTTPVASSYPGMAWPADMMMCVAALRLHDEMFAPLYTSLIQRWVSKLKANLDEHGLIPHGVHANTGKSIESARGSSQSLMLVFLHDIDPAFASEQFKVYDSLFVTTRLGLPAIYEYPRGTWGLGDIDSGPVLLGIGGAASIVGMRTLATFDHEDAIGVRNGIEAFGLSPRRKESKSYFFGTLPIADAFITWAQAGIKQTSVKQPSMIWFHLYSALAILLLLAVALKPWRRIKK
jgi:hypothetical protein